MKFFLLLLSTLFLSAGTCPAQTAFPSTGQTGLKITVLRLGEGGALLPVNARQQFQGGDRVKIQITSESAGYLYIVHRGASGKTSLLLPAAGESGVIKVGEKFLFPPTKELIFDEKGGVETLEVFVAPERLAQLDAAIKQPGTVLTAEQAVFLTGYLGGAFNDVQSKGPFRDLAFDKLDPAAASKPESKRRTPAPKPPPSATIRLNNAGKRR